MPYTPIGLFNDAGDARLFVPKRDPRFGWTVNLAHPLGGPVLVMLGLAVGAMLAAGLLAG